MAICGAAAPAYRCAHAGYDKEETAMTFVNRLAIGLAVTAMAFGIGRAEVTTRIA
jgi:hypothetical protein